MPLDIITTRFVQQNVGGLRKDLVGIAGDFLVLESHIDRAGHTAARAAGVGAVTLGVLATITSKSLEAAGQVQRVEMGYMATLRNAQKVKELSRAIRDFDVKTSFSYLESAKASQMLLAAGFREDLLPTMYAVGNATIAAGKGTDTFVRALAIMAKIKTAGVLTGVRVHQFASQGINVKEILKKQLGLTDTQMIDIGKLKLKADVVIPALIRGMNDQFGGAIQMAGKTWLGSLEILKGSADKLLASTGKVFNEDATKFVQNLTKMTDAVDKFVSTHPRVVRTVFALGSIGGTAAVIYGAVQAFTFARLAKEALTKATKADTIAEGAKATVAGLEGRAIAGGTSAVVAATRAKKGLTAATAGLTASEVAANARQAALTKVKLTPAEINANRTIAKAYKTIDNLDIAAMSKAAQDKALISKTNIKAARDAAEELTSQRFRATANGRIQDLNSGRFTSLAKVAEFNNNARARALDEIGRNAAAEAAAKGQAIRAKAEQVIKAEQTILDNANVVRRAAAEKAARTAVKEFDAANALEAAAKKKAADIAAYTKAINAPKPNVSLFKRAADVLDRPVFKFKGAQSAVKWTDPRYYTRFNHATQMDEWFDVVGGSLKRASQADVVKWNNAIAAAKAGSRFGGIRGALSKVTVGNALGGALTGVGVGMGSYDDLSALGTRGAGTKAMVTGITAAIATMFLPGAAVPIALASGFRELFNSQINRPMEKKAEEGSGLSDETIKNQQGKNDLEKSKDYFKMAAEKRAKRDKIIQTNLFQWKSSDQAEIDELNREIEQAQIMGMRQQRWGRLKQIADKKAAAEAARDAYLNRQAKEAEIERNLFKKRTFSTKPIARFDEDDASRGTNVISPREMGQFEKRSGSSQVKMTFDIPERASDKRTKRQKFKTHSTNRRYA